MQINEPGLKIIKAFEGCLKPIGGSKYTTYYCPAHVLTIGYGHTNLGGVPPHIDEGDVWTYNECEDALKADMRKFEQHVEKLGPEITDPNRFSALVSWSFNTGGPASSAVWTYARKGDVAETRTRLERWNKANGKVLAGLTRRRDSEAYLFAGEVAKALYVAGAPAEPMPQRIDPPKPPSGEVAKKVKKETTGAVVGGATATTAQTTKPDDKVVTPMMTYAFIGVGVAVALVCIILAVKKANAFVKDWA